MSTSSLICWAACGLLVGAAGCQPTTATAEEQLTAAEQRVLATHDSVMSQMDALYRRRQQLAALATPDTARVGRQRRALLGAESAMMSWMHQYHRPADSVAAARRLAYYAAQQRQIDSVARLIRHSLDSARALLPASLPPAH